MSVHNHSLRLKRLGIDTYKEAVIYMRENCHVCRSEGFEAQARVKVTLNNISIIATVNMIDSKLLSSAEASLSNFAWEFLHAKDNDEIILSHPQVLNSLSYVRSKVYGKELKKEETKNIIEDIVAGRYSDIHIATFLAGCAGGRLNEKEILDLTDSMIQSGNQLSWNSELIVDKHCIGGVPGNRTSMLVVPIVAAFGLTMPKTSSRAITSPSGTADTMEVLTQVDLDLALMQKVIEQENGCIAWGGLMRLSPADDILIQVERAIDLDSEGQMVASILSKKIAAGSTHIVIDIPIGETAKVRTEKMAFLLKNCLINTGKSLGVEVCVIFSDGSQPVGRGIGPALEAKDVLSVLQNEKNAPQDLREHALTLAGQVLEFSNKVIPGSGVKIATEILNSGKAWKKFQAICNAQGGFFEPPTAAFQHIITAKKPGKITAINNRLISRLAKLAGAPRSKAAGIELLTPIGMAVDKNQPLFIIHSDSGGELKYALSFLEQEADIISIMEIR
ncbi:MAG: thymidine phosphorylase family protein [Gammaproteobacteria bacterium]|nr:thymidine phosphorylase family protein [Gammaproteobacteria bacterium]